MVSLLMSGLSKEKERKKREEERDVTGGTNQELRDLERDIESQVEEIHKTSARIRRLYGSKQPYIQIKESQEMQVDSQFQLDNTNEEEELLITNGGSFDLNDPDGHVD